MKSVIGNLCPRSSGLLALLLRSLPLANGHYGFPVVEVNGTTSEWWEYVRPVGLDNYGEMFFPIVTWDTEPQVCGWNTTRTGHNNVKTLKVDAGTTIKFIAFAASYNQGPITPRPYDQGQDGVGHSGPGQAYMSLAPGTLEDYDGSGDWFKIATLGSTDGQNWVTDNYKMGMNITIPQATPPGKYLMRVEHFNISPYYNETQQFINCAHVEVTGAGRGTPGPTTKFPGAYNISDPGIWLPRALWHPYKPTELLKDYKGPGPDVWTG